jgi:hypothetical protein
MVSTEGKKLMQEANKAMAKNNTMLLQFMAAQTPRQNMGPGEGGHPPRQEGTEDWL